MCTPTQGVWQPAGCVSCEPVCVCVSLVRVVIICPASTHTALVSSPSLTVVHLSTYTTSECLVLWFCVSLLCDRHRPSSVHPYRVGVPVVGRTVFRLPINQSITLLPPCYAAEGVGRV